MQKHCVWVGAQGGCTGMWCTPHVCVTHNIMTHVAGTDHTYIGQGASPDYITYSADAALDLSRSHVTSQSPYIPCLHHITPI